MAYIFHKERYQLGSGELKPEQRVVVATRPGVAEASRVAHHLGLDAAHPEEIIRHTDFADGEYLPTFLTAKCLKDERLERFRGNYYDATEEDPKKKIRWGHGLEGMTVNIVHTFSGRYDIQSLDMRVFEIADSAKYNGAENVILSAYTQPHSAQERGVHDTEHERMKKEKALAKADGQSPVSRLFLKLCAVSGIDAIINPHNHCPEDTMKLAAEVNAELAPMQQWSRANGYTHRYHLDFVHVDLAPMIGTFVAEQGPEYLEFDVSDFGRKVLWVSPDLGAADTVKRARNRSGLTNSAFAVMDKTKDKYGNIIEVKLAHSINIPPTGLEGMYVVVIDDAIRTGGTMEQNISVIRNMLMDVDEDEDAPNKKPRPKRAADIKGVPEKVAVYATRTNFAGNSTNVLSSDSIDYVVITNSDPRGGKNLQRLHQKTFQIWINFLMADAARCVERGEDPNEIITPQYMAENELLKILVPHGHVRASSRNGRRIM
jgi:hypothetical protein